MSDKDPVAVALQKAQDETFVMHTHDVGGLTGAILAAVATLAVVFSKLRKMGKIDGAEGDLYKQLSEQVAKQKTDLDAAFAERNKLIAELGGLRGRVERLETCESVLDSLKARLNTKDAELEARDTENRRLMLELISLKDRIHQLELRLSADEKKFCTDCPRLAGAM